MRHTLRTRRSVLASLLLTALFTVMLGGAAAQAEGHPTRSIHVRGAVVTPASYDAAHLAALPQTTVKGVRGVALFDLVNLSGLQTPPPPPGNIALRFTVSVDGTLGKVTFGVGELNPSFGNHPALLVPGARGTSRLVVPGDIIGTRTVLDVRNIEVKDPGNAAPSDVPPGGIVVSHGQRRIALSAAKLATLPRRTVTVTFQSGSGQQTKTESGPSLISVLQAAGIPAILTVLKGDDISVTAIAGTDSYAASVTPAEATVGGRGLYVALVEDGTPLAQPRLIVDGDVRGGRYVSDVTGLLVQRH